MGLAFVALTNGGCGRDPAPTWLSRSSGELEVSLPERAHRPLRLRDPRSRVELRATLVGARSSPAEQQGELIVYREVFPGVELRHRPTAGGTEDLLVFERAPATPRLSYAIELGS